MQLFPSIHTISLWVNNLAVHPASSRCVLEKAITMVTPALMVTPAMSNGAHPGQPSRSKNNNQTYWWRQRITSVSSEYWKARLAETGSGTTSGKEREREREGGGGGARPPLFFYRKKILPGDTREGRERGEGAGGGRGETSPTRGGARSWRGWGGAAGGGGGGEGGRGGGGGGGGRRLSHFFLYEITCCRGNQRK